MADLSAYFLTWTTYGTWLHGDPRGSVDDANNSPGSDWLTPSHNRESQRRMSLCEPPFLLDPEARSIVHQAIEAHATHRDWKIHALNVRRNHVHVVVSATSHTPEIVMGQFKSWCTRYLENKELLQNRSKIWTKMGSTRWINDETSLAMAVDYVLNHQ